MMFYIDGLPSSDCMHYYFYFRNVTEGNSSNDERARYLKIAFVVVPFHFIFKSSPRMKRWLKKDGPVW